jgi:hypothetical protein
MQADELCEMFRGVSCNEPSPPDTPYPCTNDADESQFPKRPRGEVGLARAFGFAPDPEAPAQTEADYESEPELDFESPCDIETDDTDVRDRGVDYPPEYSSVATESHLDADYEWFANGRVRRLLRAPDFVLNNIFCGEIVIFQGEDHVVFGINYAARSLFVERVPPVS